MNPDFLYLDIDTEYIMGFPHLLTSMTAVMIGSMQVVLLISWESLMAELDSFG